MRVTEVLNELDSIERDRLDALAKDRAAKQAEVDFYFEELAQGVTTEIA
jgi:hypothetical protein